MHKLLHLLLIFEFMVLINCKGGGGRGGGGGGGRIGGGRGGGYYGGYGSGGDGSLSDFELYFILLPVVLVCCFYCFCLCIRKEKGEPSQSNRRFVLSNFKDVEQAGEEVYLSAFQSGTWSCRYYQYGTWHGPHPLSLNFNRADMSIQGSGTNDVGTFTVDGIYSERSLRIGLTELYQRGTGDPSQNLGHFVIIQVIYNTLCNQFEGKWYVHTYKYSGVNQIELKFVESQV